ncbi:MAG: MlaC/ttg2D family ABC transporter substrate-binding protein [Myxococcaceae bacterium]
MWQTLVVAALLGGSPGSPMAVVKDGSAEVQKLLGAKGVTVERLAAKADDSVDFAELAKRALGKEWEKLTKKQQDEFSRTMKELLRASYAQKALKDGKGGAQFSYDSESVKGNDAEVSTTIAIADEKLPVVYRLYRADPKARWRIYDVVTDEVSLVATYRDQFRKLIADKGFEGLLAALKNKRDQLEKAAVAKGGGEG